MSLESVYTFVSVWDGPSKTYKCIVLESLAENASSMTVLLFVCDAPVSALHVAQTRHTVITTMDYPELLLSLRKCVPKELYACRS